MNPYADVLLAVVGRQKQDFSRFRDCYVKDDGSEVIVFARIGGNNRAGHEAAWKVLKSAPNYLNDYDDPKDETYAHIVFSVPEAQMEMVKRIADETDTNPPLDKFDQLLDDMQQGKDNAAIRRATEVGKQIFDQIDSGQSGSVETPDGSVNIKRL